MVGELLNSLIDVARVACEVDRVFVAALLVQRQIQRLRYLASRSLTAARMSIALRLVATPSKLSSISTIVLVIRSDNPLLNG